MNSRTFSAGATAALIAVAALAALFFVGPLFHVPWWLSHERIGYVARYLEFVSGYEDGLRYPRWCPDFAAGKGYPLFDFYPPGFFFTALGCHLVTGAGPLLAPKLALALLTLLGGVGLALLALELTGGDRLAAAAGAVAFIFAPYHCADLYVRGDLAEYGAIQFLPYVFLGLERIVGRLRRGESPAGGATVLALGFAATAVGHPVAGVFAGYTGALYLLARLWRFPREALVAGVIWGGVGFVIGSALTAFWSFPVMMNLPKVQVWRAVSERYNIARVWVPPLGTAAVAPGLLFLVALALAFLRVGPRRLLPARLRATAERLLPDSGEAGNLAVWMWFTLLLTPLTWPLAGFLPVWHLPLVHFAQFPWRLLMIVSVGGAAVVALLVHVVPRGRGGARWLAALGFSALAIGATWNAARVKEAINRDEIPLTRQALVEARTTYTAGEYLPRGVARDEFLETPPAEPWKLAAGKADLRLAASGYARYEFAVDAATTARLQLAQFAYDGWTAERLGPNSGRLPVSAGERGLLTVELPAGRYNALVRWGPTKIHLQGAQLSSAGLLGLVLFALLDFVGKLKLAVRRRAGEGLPPFLPVRTPQPRGPAAIRPRDLILCLVFGCLAFFAFEAFNTYQEIGNMLEELRGARSSAGEAGFPVTAFLWRAMKFFYFYLFGGMAVGALLGILAHLLVRPASGDARVSPPRFWRAFFLLLALLLTYIQLRMLTLHPGLFANSWRWAWFAGDALWVTVVGLVGKIAPLLLLLYLLRKYSEQVVAALRRSRRILAAAAVVLAAGAALWWSSRRTATPEAANAGPNVILISLDSLRPDHISWKGLEKPYFRPTTPNIDGFLDDAVWFNQAFVPLARTLPSWMSVLTGCWPPTHGIRCDLPPRDHLLPRVPTVAQALRQAGYRTSFFLDNTNFAWMEPEVGFDEIVQPVHNVVDFSLSSSQLPLVLYYYFLNNRAGFLYDPSLRFNAAYRATYRPEYMNAEVARRLGRMRAQPKFFAAIHLCSIHVPFCVSYPYSTMFAPEKLPPGKRFGPVLNRFGYRALVDQILSRKETGQDFSAQEASWIWTQELNLYDALARSADDNFGTILEAIKKAGLYDNSYIILMSDHGENLPEKGLRYKYGSSTHGFFLWGDDDTRMSLAIKFPGRRHAGRRVEQLVRSIDLAPTLLDCVGLPPLKTAEGVSRLPDVEGRKNDRDRWVYAETGLSHPIFFISRHLAYAFGNFIQAHEIDGDTLDIYKKDSYTPNLVAVKDRMIRTEQWKLIAYPIVADKLTYKVELFNLATDRNCCQDVSTSHPQIRDELFQRLWPFIDRDLKEFGTGPVKAVSKAGRMLRENE